jgi:hypothetical protein
MIIEIIAHKFGIEGRLETTPEVETKEDRDFVIQTLRDAATALERKDKLTIETTTTLRK